MSLGHLRGYDRFRRAGALAALALALAIEGCGSSSSPREGSVPFTGVDRKKVLSDANAHNYVGEGKNKRRAELTRRERRKVLFKAAQEAAGGAAPESK